MINNVAPGIQGIADSIASQYEIPIPLVQIADDELINVICDDYGSSSFDGLTWFEAETDDFYIHLNSNQSHNNTLNNVKGRFTLAHELGHYFIPQHRKGLIDGTLKPHGSTNYLTNICNWSLEREADAFASVLLMPTTSVKDYIKGRPFHFSLIDEIATKYQVSKSAAALRFKEIGNTPILVVYAIDGKISWVSYSSDFPFHRLRYGCEKGDRVPENTVIGSYFYDFDNSDCRKEETVYAQDCFDTRNVEENERVFLEYCIEYKNRAISVFWEK